LSKFYVFREMKKTWVKDLQPGQPVDDAFVLRKKELKDFEKGSFLKLELGDRTGRIDAVVWDNPDQFYLKAKEGDFLQVRGMASVYRDNLQIKVDSFSRLDPAKVDLKEFLPTAAESPEALFAAYQKEAQSLKNPHLKMLFEEIFADSRLVEKLKLAPAAKLWHHNYLGGLLQHTLKIVAICKAAAEIYPLAKRDLLIAGALLHDIGKVSQYQMEGYIDYSDEGRLVGHIVEGCQIVSDKISKIPDFPVELSLNLKHLILSHQGELELGSPVVPQTLEAIILHHADQMDAQVGGVTRIIQNEREPGKKWSSYVNLIKRFIYFGDESTKKERG